MTNSRKLKRAMKRQLKKEQKKNGLSQLGNLDDLITNIAPNLALLPTLSSDEVTSVDFASEFDHLSDEERNKVNGYISLLHKKHFAKKRSDKKALSKEMDDLMDSVEDKAIALDETQTDH